MDIVSRKYILNALQENEAIIEHIKNNFEGMDAEFDIYEKRVECRITLLNLLGSSLVEALSEAEIMPAIE